MWSTLILASMANDKWWFTWSCPVKYPCCTYTISLLTLREMDFWEVGDVGLVRARSLFMCLSVYPMPTLHEIPIRHTPAQPTLTLFVFQGEDHHTALRLWFTFEENARYTTLNVPVYVTHVGGDTFLKAMWNRYQQAKRHALASVDVAYVPWRIWRQRKSLPAMACIRCMLEMCLHFLQQPLGLPVTFIFFNLAPWVWDTWGSRWWVDGLDCSQGLVGPLLPIALCADYTATLLVWLDWLKFGSNFMNVMIIICFGPSVEYLHFRHERRKGLAHYTRRLICRWLVFPIALPLLVFLPAMHALSNIMVRCSRTYILTLT
jgi:hypothetical protein